LRNLAFVFAGIFVVASCNQTPIETPTRSFDAPTDAAITCAIFNPTKAGYSLALGGWQGLYEPLSLEDCRPLPTEQLRSYVNPDFPDDPTQSYYPLLRVLVTNSARGEVALVDVANETLYDLDHSNPGFNFIPVGQNPQGIRASADGCMAVTANADSCDLSVLDTTIMYNMAFVPGRTTDKSDLSGAGDMSGIGADYANYVVRQIQMYAGGKLLQARATSVELTDKVDHPTNDLTCYGGEYHAWVALPGCQAVVEVALDLKGTVDPIRADVTRAISVTSAGAQVIDPSTLSCPAECTGTSTPMDFGTPDLSVPDMGLRLPNDIAAPANITYNHEDQTQRLAISDLYGESVAMFTLDPITGAPGQPLSVKLESGALGVAKIRISPRTAAGKFLYAAARDGSMRVVDLDRLVECETNPDPTVFNHFSPNPDGTPTARQYGCLPLGDPSTPVRAPGNISPGIELPGGALARDVAFVHLDIPVPPTSGAPFSAQPALLAGDFAWVIGSDGHATVVNIYDECLQPNDSLTADGTNYTDACAITNALPTRFVDYSGNFGGPFPVELERISHRIRNAERRFQQPDSAADNFGTPRIQDPSDGNRVTVTVHGSSAQTSPGVRLPDLDSVTRTLDDPQIAAKGFPGVETVLDFPDFERARDETWSLSWEGPIPGTNRAFGTVCGSGNASCPRGTIVDAGGGFCAHGVMPGDKVELVGCVEDANCLYTQSCAHDPNAPSAPGLVTNGLCLDKDNQDAMITHCAPLLGAQRRYRVVPKQDVTLPSGDVSSVLELSEIYEPEFTAPPGLSGNGWTHTCVTQDDCQDVTVQSDDQFIAAATLQTKCLRDSDGQNRCLVDCGTDTGNPNLQNAGLCGQGYECAETNTSTAAAPDFRCMRAPLDLGLIDDCMPQSFPQRYQVRTGDAFLVDGSESGFLFEDEPDPVTGICELPPVSSERTRLRNPRIPLDAPECPQQVDPTKNVDALTWVQAPGPNVCKLDYGDPDLVIHFQNEIVMFALRLADNPTGYVPADYTIVNFVAVGGGGPLGTTMSVPGTQAAQAPVSAVVAPDQQTVFVVDEGKGSITTSVRGQLFRLVSSVQQVDPTFIVH
jgi:hypothetical protein